jgi:hypothetical protein
MTGKVFRQMCGTVLILEAIVIGLAIPVAIMDEHLRHGVAGGVGGGLAVCALLLSGMVGRPRLGWALWAGTVLQVLVIASGVVVPAMYILGVVFAALWITAVYLARRLQTLPPPRAPETRVPDASRAPETRVPDAPQTSETRVPDAPQTSDTPTA